MRYLFDIRRMVWLLACLLGYLFLMVGGSDSYLLIRFLDVGQGDAVLLLDSDEGVSVLVDGGPYSQVIYELDEVLPFWQRDLTTVIATHPDDDHISGLVEVLKRYDVGVYAWNGVERETPPFQALSSALDESGTRKYVPKRGEVMRMSGRLTLRWWWPDEQRSGLSVNDGSQVVLIESGYFSVLLTGDVEARVLQRLVREYGGTVDVLKVPHHGSKDGLSEEIVQILRPDLAIISVGADNRYGHPNREVLEILRLAGIDTLRTDRDGAITLKVRGDGVSVYR